MQEIIHGDCLEKLKELEDNSIDAVVTDPPYGIGFMGKEWDNFKPREIKKTTKLVYKTDYVNGVPVKRKKPEEVTRDSGARIAGSYDLSLTGNQKYQDWYCEIMKECLRVLKPGGHLLSFGGTRTYHRMAVAIEDAGFEVRDMVEWVYGSGFPKSLNIGRTLAKMKGEDVKIGKAFVTAGEYGDRDLRNPEAINDREQFRHKSSDPEVKQWEGWGTALKPAHEPICMARKPLQEKTVAENVLKYGTGGINIAESRVGTEKVSAHHAPKGTFAGGEPDRGSDTNYYENTGRFPSNFIHDNSEEVRECFPETKSGGGDRNSKGKTDLFTGFGDTGIERPLEANSGNASRFFKSILYYAKAPKSERLLSGFDSVKLDLCKDENMEQVVSLARAILDLVLKSLNIEMSGENATAIFPQGYSFTIRTAISRITDLKTWNLLTLQPTSDSILAVIKKAMSGISPVKSVENEKELTEKIGIFLKKIGLSTEDVKNATLKSLVEISKPENWQDAYSNHPTHKPIALMEYLIKMVTPKGGIVLDPFAGSGTTLVAAKQNGFNYIGIEREEEYIKIIEARLASISKSLF